jgi:tetratricopeptide (TPR) repeat protein
MKKLNLVAAGILMASVAGTLGADVLVLTDGKRLEGRVEEIRGSKDRVAFVSGSGRIELPLARIKERIEEPDEKDWTRVGDQFLEAKSNLSAVQMYQRALESNTEFQPAKDGLAKAQQAINEEQDSRRRQTQEAIGKELESISKMILEERFEEAKAALDRLISADATEQQRTTGQRLMRDLYLAWGYSRFDRLDYVGAEEYYQRVLEMDPQNAEARDQLLAIWKDNPAKRPEVLKAYQARLAEDPNNLALNQTVGDLLYREERWEEAIGPLTKVAAQPRFAGQGYDEKLKRCFQMSINTKTDQRKLDEAIALYQQMLGIFPYEDRTSLTVLTYERDKTLLAKDDYEGQAALARKLYDGGLTALAEREAQLILRYDPENKIADSILRSEAEAQLQHIQTNFQAQDYLVARNLAEKFVANEKRYGDLIEKAEEIRRKSDIEVQRQAKANREAALRLAENGINAYNEAQRNVELMTDDNRRSDTYVTSYKQNAISNCRRAIERFDTALQLDPTLGPSTGMDLSARRRDAQMLLARLTGSATSLPTVRNR